MIGHGSKPGRIFVPRYKPPSFLISVVALFILLFLPPDSLAQKKKAARTTAQRPTELAKLRDDYIEATRQYKVSLEKLVASYERDVVRAQEELTKSEQLYKEGLISKIKLTEFENALAAAKNKVDATRQQMTTADSQIANTLLEARAEAQIARLHLRKGSLLTTTAYIRYNGPANWSLPDAGKIQRFFQDTFKRPLPIAVLGQGAIHDRWRLDHHNAMDVSLHPDGVEGQALINFLRSNGIPFLAFRSAIPGTATGPHIHVGRPSHRF